MNTEHFTGGKNKQMDNADGRMDGWMDALIDGCSLLLWEPKHNEASQNHDTPSAMLHRCSQMVYVEQGSSTFFIPGTPWIISW